MTDFAFLHGGGQGSWVWDETIAAMKAQSGDAHRYLALDVPGCGAKRGRDTSAIGFDAIVGELVGDVRDADFGDVVLVGHSQAGTVLPRMAASAPELFARLVHVSTIAPDPGLDVIEMSSRRMTAERSEAVNRSFFDETMPAAERFGLKFCNDMAPDQAAQFLAKLGEDNWPRSSYEVSDWNHRAAGVRAGQLCAVPARCGAHAAMAGALCRAAGRHIAAPDRCRASGDELPSAGACGNLAGGSDNCMNETLLQASALIVPLILAIVFHEVAHGWTARLLGDPTAAQLGRLSLNPLRHVDLMGTIIVPGVLKLMGGPVFGWAKPVPVVKQRLRNPRFGMMAVAIAGPGSNLVLAAIGAVLLGLMFSGISGVQDQSEFARFAALNLINFITINVFLALFNLLPIPPFDGSHIVHGLLPQALAGAL